MLTKMETKQQWRLASVALTDAYTDFMLSRQAMQCTSATLEFYSYAAGGFVSWLDQSGITEPSQVTARHVREYLSNLVGSGYADNSVHGSARAIKTLVRFWHEEKYLPEPVTFAMPKIAKKRLPVLTAEQLNTVLKACRTPRDKAVILFMADSGLRRAEGQVSCGRGFQLSHHFVVQVLLSPQFSS